MTHGAVRDVDEYIGYGMPVYGRDRAPIGARPLVVRGLRNRGEAGRRARATGDIILADKNGTVVIPKECVTEVMEFANKVKATEER